MNTLYTTISIDDDKTTLTVCSRSWHAVRLRKRGGSSDQDLRIANIFADLINDGLTAADVIVIMCLRLGVSRVPMLSTFLFFSCLILPRNRCQKLVLTHQRLHGHRNDMRNILYSKQWNTVKAYYTYGVFTISVGDRMAMGSVQVLVYNKISVCFWYTCLVLFEVHRFCAQTTKKNYS